MEFTFCSFTYNQEKYVLTQLNSIKYQIDHFGSDIDCYYLLCDDCSTDNTVDVVKQWLCTNNMLFKKIEIIVAKRNAGIVSNYTTALRNIKTKYFKILAGDDFYYRNNVFEVCQKGDFVISPVIFLALDNSVAKGKYGFIKNLLSCGKDSEKVRRFLLSQYRFGGGVSAPGVFISHNIIDEGLFKALEPYKWIEDAPEFYYLFSKPDVSIYVENKPFIIYRLGGEYKWDKKNNTPMGKEICKDVERMNKHIHVLRRNWPRFINPFFYWRTFDRGKMFFKRLCNPALFKEVKKFKHNIAVEKNNTADYIKEIIQ